MKGYLNGNICSNIVNPMNLLWSLFLLAWLLKGGTPSTRTSSLIHAFKISRTQSYHRHVVNDVRSFLEQMKIVI